MKQFLLNIVVLTSFLVSCKNKDIAVNYTSIEDKRSTRIEQLIQHLQNPNEKHIMVVAHRADWRNAPENSIQAIQSCIDMGVDMVEIDVQQTKDGHLVLMHDKTIDRTTTGKGMVSDWTLDSLKTLRLKDGLGIPTQNQIPTLEEALLVCKNKILVNLDKSYPIFDNCFEIAQRTETLDHIIIKGVKTKNEVQDQFGKYLDKVHFMPIVRLSDANSRQVINEYLNEQKPPIAFEFTVPQDTISLIKDFGHIRSKGSSIWVNSLWPQHNGGHDDEKAYLDPSIYEWFIRNNVNMIQTDRPQLLLEYLRKRGYHN